MVAVGQLVVNPGGHGERVRPVASDVSKLRSRDYGAADCTARAAAP